MSDIDQRLSKLERRLDGLEHLAREIRSLVGPFGALLPDGRMLVHTLHHIKLIIDPLDAEIASTLIVYRQWEPEITNALLGAVGKDTVFCDIGAHIGYYTCLVGSKIGRSGSGRVIAVEPNPDCFELLQRNIEINWSMCPIDARRTAAGDFEGKAQLSVPRRHGGQAHLGQISGEACPNSFEVSVEPLDQIVPADLALDILKIDVEGYESAVLEGARNVIRRSPRIAIVLEWYPALMRRTRHSSGSLLELFDDLGLVAHRVPTTLASLGDEHIYPREELAGTEYTNIVLTRRDRLLS